MRLFSARHGRHLFSPAGEPSQYRPVIEGLEARRLMDGDISEASAEPISIECFAMELVASSTPLLSGFTVVNASTNGDIGALATGGTVDLTTSTKKVTVRAEVAAGSVAIGSVVWALDGKVFRTENWAPFATTDDTGGKFFPWALSLGAHTLTATPYAGGKATGAAGPALTVSFTALGPGSQPPTTPPPTPGATPTLSINDVSANEGNAGTTGLSFTVTRTGGTTGASTVKWTTQNGTAGEGDYQVASGTISFATGEISKPIIISLKGDTKVEPDENFRVILSSATGATIADNSGQGTIVNDDLTTTPPPTPIPPTPSDPKEPTASVMRQWELHQANLNRIKQGPADLLFLGDSITDWFDSTGKSVYDANYKNYKPANFGIAGDKTQNVIWRITEGKELEGINPKAIVLMIGTNNLGEVSSDTKIADGIKKIVAIIRQKLPNTKILLLGIFPRGGATDARRARIANINSKIDDLHDGNHVTYLDIGKKFLDSSNNIPTSVMADGLHPTAKGYQIWADAMRPTLNSLLS